MSGITEAQSLEVVSRHMDENDLTIVVQCLKLPYGKLDWLLRDHTIDEDHWVTRWSEIEKRNAFDGALGAASALQVIRIATGELPQLPTSYRNAFYSLLSSVPVQAFYCERYPLALPTLFRHDLTASLLSGAVKSTGQKNSPLRDRRILPHLVSFFELDGRLWSQESLSFFLSLMDDYNFEGIWLGDILDMASKPKKFEEIAFSKSKKLVRERNGLRGLDEFLTFAFDLHECLEQLSNEPLLRSAIWLHFCYWFGNGGEGVHYTAEYLKKSLGKWSRRASDSGQQHLVVKKIKQANRVLNDLTNWKKHALPLVDHYAPLLDEWAAKQS